MNNYYTLEPINMSFETNKMELTNWKYRQYIQKNANDIMKHNSMEYINASGNNPYTLINNKPVEHTPYLYANLYDTSQPKCGYRNTDLKQAYMKKEQMKARMVAPSISTQF
jgi:hypothetical protein